LGIKGLVVVVVVVGGGGVKYSKSQPLKSQCESKIKCGNPHEVKKKCSGRIKFCASTSLRSYLYLILSIGCHSIKSDTTWITNKVSMLT
jgi:hypothetical protein